MPLGMSGPEEDVKYTAAHNWVNVCLWCGVVCPQRVTLIANNNRGCHDCGIVTSSPEGRNLPDRVGVYPPAADMAVGGEYLPKSLSQLAREKTLGRARATRALRRLNWSTEAQLLANQIREQQRRLSVLLMKCEAGIEACQEEDQLEAQCGFVCEAEQQRLTTFVRTRVGREAVKYYHVRDLFVQGDVVLETGHESAMTQQETVAFVDESAGLRVGVDESYDGVSGMDQTTNTSLSDFLKRPVRIASFTWNEADAVGTTNTFAPWHLYFNDTRVKYKLNNFAFIQAKLKVKVLINASPFYYGAMIGSYIPNVGLTPSTIVNDAGTRYFIPLSQRPHMWILPQGSKGDEMTLPFFYHKNFLNIQSAAALTAMGSISFVNYTALASANGAVGVGVSVQVYAWAEDVKLSGPSVGLSMQGGDEYGNGVVSAPATAIANGAKWFENIPIIGRFATATRIGASAVSSIASMFGFTDVPNVNTTEPFRPTAFPQLASTAISYPTEKLTVDPKNELTIDPSVLGLPPTDEMVISHLVQRESYLTTATWSSTNAVDDILFSARVAPAFFDNDNAIQSKVYQIPLCWISQLFKNWRGDIIFRFKFVASPYHKGRVRISFDPAGYAATNIINDAVSQTVVMTQIVDLGEESDVEVRIPYQQATAFMQNRTDLTASAISWSTSLTPTFSYSDIFDNGTITMRVQTNLTAPVAVTSVPILVFVRGAENIEFANPCELGNYSMFAPQSGEVYGDPMTMVAGKVTNVNPDRFLLNFGESVKSLRQLLRRFSLVSVEMLATDSSHYCLVKRRFSRFPVYFGYDPKGTHSAVGLVVAANFPFNFSKVTPFNWVAPAFVAHRGSMQWNFNHELPPDSTLQHIRVYRDTQNSGDAGTTVVTRNPKGSVSNGSAFFALNASAGASGMAVTSQETNSGLTVQLPNYTRFRMQTTSPAQSTDLSNVDGSDIDAHVVEYDIYAGTSATYVTNSRLWQYSSIGTDYGLHFFLNVPTVWIYSAYPTPN